MVKVLVQDVFKLSKSPKILVAWVQHRLWIRFKAWEQKLQNSTSDFCLAIRKIIDTFFGKSPARRFHI